MGLFSVIVPVYNVEPYLERCISSLLRQETRELEIILVDDGSTDGSLALCRKYEQADSRVRVIHKENGGLASARNAGMELASGDYICFVDSDDWLKADTLSAMQSIIAEYHPDVIRYGYEDVVNGEVTGQYHLPDAEGLYTGEALEGIRLETINSEYVLDFGHTRVLTAWGGLFRRALLEEHQLRFASEREILNEDYLFVLEAMLRAQSVYVCTEEYYCYFKRTGSLSTVYRKAMYERKKALYARYCQLLPEEDDRVASRLRNFYIDSVYDCIVNEITGKPASQAISGIRGLLQDEYLQVCLRENRGLERGIRVKGICFLMRCRMAAGMFFGYRLLKKLKKKA